jgi:hypothetical protein
MSTRWGIPVLILACAAATAFGAERYFPRESQGGLSAFEQKWYGGALRRMHESSLLGVTRDPKAVVYRFTLLPTWGNPVTVRTTRHGDHYRLSLRRLDGMGGYELGHLAEQKEIELSPGDSAAFDRLIARAAFFTIPISEESGGTDGEEWILEAVSGGKYHVVDRWCPNVYDTKKRKLEGFVALCIFLLHKTAQDPTNKGERILSHR